MSVTIRPYKRGGFEADIRFTANGKDYRVRKKAPGSSKSGAMRWAESQQHELITRALDNREPPPILKEVPTISEFAPRFLAEYAEANRQKPSGIASKETILRVHLLPVFGTLRLDAITNERIQNLKTRLKCKAPKTVNNVLTVMNTLLKVAVEWEVIDQMPCTVRLLKVPKKRMGFLEFHEFDALVGAAEEIGSAALVAVLLGGEASLRCGEIMGLRWCDVDFDRQRVCAAQSIWRGHVTATKGGEVRDVKMTGRLLNALRGHRHLRSQYVLCKDDGRPLTQHDVQNLVGAAANRAGIKRGVHILRHSFCSHLSISGAQPAVIQQLAGHKNLSTTQIYMHLSPMASDSAIKLLDERLTAAKSGDILETSKATKAKQLSAR
jgi:integrase